MDENQMLALGLPPSLPSANYQLQEEDAAASLLEQAVVAAILELFPEVAPDHVSILFRANAHNHTVEAIADILLQGIEDGRPYPKSEALKKQKRKRSITSDGEQDHKYNAKNRNPVSFGERLTMQVFQQRTETQQYANRQSCSKSILSVEFPQIPMKRIDTAMAECGHHLYPVYMALYKLDRDWKATAPTYTKLKCERRNHGNQSPDLLDRILLGQDAIALQYAPHNHIYQELKAAREAKGKMYLKSTQIEEEERKELENERQAKADGMMEECGCCYGGFPRNRMVHCNQESTCHFFCKSCAKMNASTEVGQGKYVLVCMSMDECSAGFSRDQRELFMDTKLTIALERLEAEANLRMAGIENLESCPFCPYAAEYPPISIDKVFRCLHPDCLEESCRLCRKVAHIPKTCEELAKESDQEALQRQLENKMSDALIRKCNNCKTPFIKMDGCNKITCTKCRNVQCYICGKDCVAVNGSTYAHFNDIGRGGSENGCKLFDSTEKRHQDEVEAARKAAMTEIEAQHPHIKEGDLKFEEAPAFKEDRERRLAADPYVAINRVERYNAYVELGNRPGDAARAGRLERLRDGYAIARREAGVAAGQYHALDRLAAVQARARQHLDGARGNHAAGLPAGVHDPFELFANHHWPDNPNDLLGQDFDYNQYIGRREAVLAPGFGAPAPAGAADDGIDPAIMLPGLRLLRARPVRADVAAAGFEHNNGVNGARAVPERGVPRPELRHFVNDFGVLPAPRAPSPPMLEGAQPFGALGIGANTQPRPFHHHPFLPHWDGYGHGRRGISRANAPPLLPPAAQPLPVPRNAGADGGNGPVPDQQPQRIPNVLDWEELGGLLDVDADYEAGMAALDADLARDRAELARLIAAHPPRPQNAAVPAAPRFAAVAVPRPARYNAVIDLGANIPVPPLVHPEPYDARIDLDAANVDLANLRRRIDRLGEAAGAAAPPEAPAPPQPRRAFHRMGDIMRRVRAEVRGADRRAQAVAVADPPPAAAHLRGNGGLDDEDDLVMFDPPVRNNEPGRAKAPQQRSSPIVISSDDDMPVVVERGMRSLSIDEGDQAPGLVDRARRIQNTPAEADGMPRTPPDQMGPPPSPD